MFLPWLCNFSFGVFLEFSLSFMYVPQSQLIILYIKFFLFKLWFVSPDILVSLLLQNQLTLKITGLQCSEYNDLLHYTMAWEDKRSHNTEKVSKADIIIHVRALIAITVLVGKIVPVKYRKIQSLAFSFICKTHIVIKLSLPTSFSKILFESFFTSFHLHYYHLNTCRYLSSFIHRPIKHCN